MLRQYLVSGGHRGACPGWYRLLRGARYLGVPPWELERQPAFWLAAALEAEAAEAWADAEREKRSRVFG